VEVVGGNAVVFGEWVLFSEALVVDAVVAEVGVVEFRFGEGRGGFLEKVFVIISGGVEV